jgi:hypothetical protein
MRYQLKVLMLNIWFYLVGFNQRLGQGGFVSAALSVGSLILGGIGLFGQSDAQKAAGRAAAAAGEANKEINQRKARISRENARIARENAVIAKDRAELEVGDISRAGKALESTQRAVIGASGVTTAGSAGDVIREGKRTTAQDIMITRMLGEDTAKGFLQESEQFEAESDLFKLAGATALSEGRSAQRLANRQAGATLLTGGARILAGASDLKFKKPTRPTTSSGFLGL